MIIKKLQKTVLLASTFALTTAAYATCANNVTLNIGELEGQLSHQDEVVDDVLPKEMDLTEKYNYAENVLASKTHELTLASNQSNGRSRKCTYSSNEMPELKVILSQTGRRAVALSIVSNLETLSSDDEYDIYHNQIILNKKLSQSRSLRRGEVAFHGILKSRNHYYYSCGFIDCTYTNDDVRDLSSTGLSLSWN